MKTYGRFQQAFPGGPAPAQVAVKVADISSPTFAAELDRFRTAALATGQMHNPITMRPLGNDVALISVPLAGQGDDRASVSALRTLRGRVIPSTLARAAGVQSVAVGGATAQSVDASHTLNAHTPLVFTFVLALAFLLLLITFRSVVIAIKAIVLNLLSVAAAYGFLVAAFQWG
jgi:RND superfamily putative drug exporter